MAYGYTSNPGPDAGDTDNDNLYGEEEGKGSEEQPQSVDEQEQEEMNERALIPIKVLQAGPDDKVKVGDERVVKVIAVHDTQAEVEYSKTPPEEIGKDEGEHGEGMHEGMHHGRSEDEEMEEMMNEA